MHSFVYALVSVLVVSLVSLIGVITLALNPKILKKTLGFLVAFSVGALIGDSFIHLLPEAIETGIYTRIFAVYIFAGILLFFCLEKFLRWRHCHDIACEEHPRHLGIINLVSDGVHNLIDGLLIGASFVVSIPLGIATTTAVILHEIPQELGDFGVLLHSGFTVKKALLFNFLSASLAIISTMIAFWIGARATLFIDFMIPFTIGGFIYIALSDLVPELHKETKPVQAIIDLGGISLGIAVMFLLLLVG